jgi:hypothetical protein
MSFGERRLCDLAITGLRMRPLEAGLVPHYVEADSKSDQKRWNSCKFDDADTT